MVELGEKGHNLQILTSFFIHRVGENKTLSACVCVCVRVCVKGEGGEGHASERETHRQRADKGSHCRSKTEAVTMVAIEG